MPRNLALRGFLGRLPLDLASSFSPAQLAAIELHFCMRHRLDHTIDWRARFSFPFAKLYIVLLAGKENRAAS